MYHFFSHCYYFFFFDSWFVAIRIRRIRFRYRKEQRSPTIKKFLFFIVVVEATIIKDVVSFASSHTHVFVMKRDVLFALDIFTQRIYKLQTFNQNLLYNFVTVRMVSIHSIIIPNVSFSSRLIANLSNKKIGFEVLSLAKIVIRFITRREGRNKKKIRWIILDEEKKKKKIYTKILN